MDIEHLGTLDDKDHFFNVKINKNQQNINTYNKYSIIMLYYKKEVYICCRPLLKTSIK